MLDPVVQVVLDHVEALIFGEGSSTAGPLNVAEDDQGGRDDVEEAD